MTVRIVNMIPQAQSAETNQDCHPFLAVSKDDPSLMIGTASTYDNSAGSSANPPGMNGSSAPIYLSQDSGKTWTLKYVVPVQPVLPVIPPVPTLSAISVGFGANETFYAAAWTPPIDGGITNLCASRIGDLTESMAMNVTPLYDGTGGTVPYLQAVAEPTPRFARTPSPTSRVYVAYFDTGSGQATITRSLDAEHSSQPSGAWFSTPLDLRLYAANWVPRVAIHQDGTIYGAFIGCATQAQATLVPPDRNFAGEVKIVPPVLSADVIVLRDDNWAAAKGFDPVTQLPKSFPDLIEPADNLPGRIAVSQINVPWLDSHLPDFGQERIVGGDLAIAVDPGDSKQVYLAYAGGTSSDDYTIHVISSSDGGNSWSGDLRTVLRAKNFSLAINELGQVGFLYQQIYQPREEVRAQPRWVTKCEISSNSFTNHRDFVLANVPAMTPAAASVFGAYIGDYVNLVAVGKDFYGIFCANNTPDMNNFPNGVSYQRNADFGAKHLLDLNGKVVPASIDPFFLHISETVPGYPHSPGWLDPLAVILANWLYVLLHTPDPPTWEVLQAQAIELAQRIAPGEKGSVLVRLKMLELYVQALERELRKR